uniref:Tubulin monoglycylase TTLL3-like n=1 Tax=Mesocestoides corti TaxID=53468 RepID=A0A5K3FZW1_MESCO
MTINQAILMALSVCTKHLRALGLDSDDDGAAHEEVVDGEEEGAEEEEQLEEAESDTFMTYTNAEWDAFLTCFYATHRHQSPYSDEDAIFKRSQRLCDLMQISFPQFNLDGQRNIWIVKPGSKSRGRGITCQKKLETIILLTTGTGMTMDERFVVQKYIERPLLIYKTKFDIRQWFLVSDWQPLTIWWYRECYLRFCSREFTLDCFSEDIHLSNNSITHKYKNGNRSPLLPAENMWYLEEFRQHLENTGHRHVWELKILPGMQEAIIHSMLCSQDSIDARKGSFELYGADFMISEDDFRPWLIEINASPCMAPSTSVTSVLTAQVLEDTLKG